MRIGDRVEITNSDYPQPPEGLQGVVIDLKPESSNRLAQAHVRLDRYITRDWWLYQMDLRVLDAVDALAELGRTSPKETGYRGAHLRRDRKRPARG